MQQAHYGLKEIVMLLVNCGADINQQCWAKHTAFMYAIAERHVEIAIYLLEHGADVFVSFQ